METQFMKKFYRIDFELTNINTRDTRHFFSIKISKNDFRTCLSTFV